MRQPIIVIGAVASWIIAGCTQPALQDSYWQNDAIAARQHQAIVTGQAPQLKQELEKETQRVKALKAKIPSAQQVATQKFITKVDRIFSSMEDYYISSMGSQYGGGILRKDIDRYDDAIVEAKGEVPDEIIAYVEEVYRALRKGLGTINSDDLTTRTAKRMAMITLAE
jgi:hypothetical protein